MRIAQDYAASLPQDLVVLHMVWKITDVAVVPGCRGWAVEKLVERLAHALQSYPVSEGNERSHLDYNIFWESRCANML